MDRVPGLVGVAVLDVGHLLLDLLDQRSDSLIGGGKQPAGSVCVNREMDPETHTETVSKPPTCHVSTWTIRAEGRPALTSIVVSLDKPAASRPQSQERLKDHRVL